jgi:hypothetical protein
VEQPRLVTFVVWCSSCCPAVIAVPLQLQGVRAPDWGWCYIEYGTHGRISQGIQDEDFLDLLQGSHLPQNTDVDYSRSPPVRTILVCTINRSA